MLKYTCSSLPLQLTDYSFSNPVTSSPKSASSISSVKLLFLKFNFSKQQIPKLGQLFVQSRKKVAFSFGFAIINFNLSQRLLTTAENHDEHVFNSPSAMFSCSRAHLMSLFISICRLPSTSGHFNIPYFINNTNYHMLVTE